MKESLIFLLLAGYIDPGNGFNFFNMLSGLFISIVSLLGVFGIFFKTIYKSLKPYKKIVFFVGLFIIGGIIFKGVVMDNKSAENNNKVIILGIDALSPDIIQRMMDQGKLPNFSRLKEQGSFKKLATTNPAQSPVAWAAFATGKNPGKNGMFDFIVRDPKTYELNLSLSKNKGSKPQRVLKSKCFWHFTSKEKIPTTIICCPVTFPPDKVSGKMLSGMGVPDILGTQGTFTFYTSGPVKEDVGGKVIHIPKSKTMEMQLIGPRISGFHRDAQNVCVPFTAVLKDNKTLIIDYQNKQVELNSGQWSDWQEVTFSLGLFKKARGIFKFYMVSTEPEFNLYISPINFNPQKPLFSISYPPSYSKELFDKIGYYHTQGMPLDTWALNEGRISEEAFLQQVEQVFQERQSILDLELNRLENGVLFCYFGCLDTVQHMFLHNNNIDGIQDQKQFKHKNIVEYYYRQMDSVLGKALDKIEDNDTIIVLSDHGMVAFKRAVHVNSWLKENGYLYLKENGLARSKGLLNDIDWSKTKAYAIGFGAIYINQQYREAGGIVRPGVETEQLKQEIAQKLMRWKDLANGESIINKVYKQQEIFWGQYAGQGPDLYIGFNPGYRASWQTAVGATSENLIDDNLKKWAADHLVDPSYIPGVVFCNKRIKNEHPSLYSIAPTVLKLIGYDQEKIKQYDFDADALF